MKITLIIFLALTGWFAIIAQYFLMIENSTAPIAESTIRFFSYFTILTNIIVACYFTSVLFSKKDPSQPNILTAITLYITVVGLIYQLLLRQVWDPKGLQKVVDELLHTIIPITVIIYWYFYSNKSMLQYPKMFGWFLYPIAYLVYVLIRGYYSGFYPYPFIDVSKLGPTAALINAGFITFLFAALASLFIFIGRAIYKKNRKDIFRTSFL